MLYTHAKFSIQGYVGAIREVGKTLKIRISDTESWKDRDTGERKERVSWNTVTLFERTPGFAYIKENLRKGDLVTVEGKLSESSYEKDGHQVYETTLAADLFAIIPTGRAE
ncbi:single-stranded DNA-binding protein (plasmid) [Paracoccus versutus]|uniref:Single-strand DNA-binding protein n=1 Tax=Paracoccus versutus TaxID=34007 RepID=A0AAQ0KJY0_PARVE|nr:MULTISPECIES: single-stranded DNA-binding protein [Paracoccus]REG35232.1 single-strand DNA-binding protein [Paracoccus versutus]WEJ80010.1 single-stranded DNA-binding protein [Paracoccus versutus]